MGLWINLLRSNTQISIAWWCRARTAEIVLNHESPLQYIEESICRGGWALLAATNLFPEEDDTLTGIYNKFSLIWKFI